MRDDEVLLTDLRAEALELLKSVDEGDRLDEQTAALIGLAVRVTASTLDMEGSRTHAERALDAGATPDQVHETLVLVSGMGVHTLIEGSRRIADLLRARLSGGLRAARRSVARSRGGGMWATTPTGFAWKPRFPDSLTCCYGRRPRDSRRSSSIAPPLEDGSAARADEGAHLARRRFDAGAPLPAGDASAHRPRHRPRRREDHDSAGPRHRSPGAASSRPALSPYVNVWVDKSSPLVSTYWLTRGRAR
jgi:alkylhydroperoxidase/carboxymuconolactone decarboxylase family protein YurZ